MGAAVEVRPGSAAGMLEQRREAMDRALTMRDGWDIALLTDEQFEEELRLTKIRIARIERIIKEDCIQGVDYGKVAGIDKPFAWEGAADKICRRLRWSALIVGAPAIQQVGEGLSVTITCVIRDNAGHDLISMVRSCSTFEKRFRRKGSSGDKGVWKFVKPEEAINELVAMAFKRARVAGTLSAGGVKHLFANPDQLKEDEDAAAEVAEEQKPLTLEQALNVVIKGAALSTIRNAALRQMVAFAQGKLDQDPEQPALARNLEALRLVLAAREAGELEEPPKAAPAPIKQDGYEEPAREPGEEG